MRREEGWKEQKYYGMKREERRKENFIGKELNEGKGEMTRGTGRHEGREEQNNYGMKGIEKGRGMREKFWGKGRLGRRREPTNF